jgi:2-methylcitrate dehydratase PrpD
MTLDEQSSVGARARMASMDADSAYLAAFTDWLACACAGADEPAPKAVRASGADLTADVAFAATAGHVLDFDDTFSEGVAHVSAASAPAALVLAAHLGRSLGEALAAYAEGYEAMAAVAAASHPALYNAGWHPTAVCAPIGAAVAASRLLDMPPPRREHAIALGLLRAGGTRGAFGSDGKAIQVGLAAAAGVQAALLANAGATVDHRRAIHGPLGFAAVLGASWPEAGIDRAGFGDAPRAIERNWIKLSPSCLGTHAPIEAAELARERGYRPGEDQLTVLVHPLARQAAHLDLVDDGLSAKFSIPYCVAQTFMHGPPRVCDFDAIDAAARESSRRVTAVSDESVPEFGAVLVIGEHELARVSCPRGAPDRPATTQQLADKIAGLTGDQLRGVLDNLRVSAATALEAAGLQSTAPGVTRPA